MSGIYPQYVGPTEAHRRVSLYPTWTDGHLLRIDLEAAGGGSGRLIYKRTGPSLESIKRADLVEQIKREDEELMVILAAAIEVLNAWEI